MPAVRTYRRPMTAWWKRNPWYRAYMLREMTSVVIVLYALFLLCGLYHLAHGPETWARWRAALDTPLSIVLHAAVLAVMVYHAWTWFAVMPKTLPFVRIGGRRVGDAAIVRMGITAGIGAFVVLIALALWATR
jgi:fumarate reductase subunit C